MRLLILGGTKFLGRHVVDAALARGHEVTIFTRGQTNPDLYPEGVEKLRGDRDGNLAALEGRTWDAVIDPSCYVPRIARMSAELLRDAVKRYIFISTISVYGDLSKPIDESTPLAELEDPTSEDITKHYGALKVACERVFDEVYGERVTHVRAGLIVGPFDNTDRFTYWPRRLHQAGDVLVPGERNAPVQFVDARDLATFIILLAERGPGGPLNATGPVHPITMEETVTRMNNDVGNSATLHWVDSQFIIDAGIKPFTQLPLWMPGADLAGLMATDCSKAIAAGLTFRSLEETTADTLKWSLEAGPQRETLSPEKEAELLRAAGKI
jgi:2'-hydroxyisoflavone reductase